MNAIAEQKQEVKAGQFLTVIDSNGSKWAGESPDSIDTLLDVMGKEPLDPTFEKFGNFVSPAHGSVCIGYKGGKLAYRDTGPIYPDHPLAVVFFGNFFNVSHVFNITTDDPEVINKLNAAIRANQKTDAYIAARSSVQARAA